MDLSIYLADISKLQAKMSESENFILNAIEKHTEIENRLKVLKGLAVANNLINEAVNLGWCVSWTYGKALGLPYIYSLVKDEMLDNYSMPIELTSPTLLYDKYELKITLGIVSDYRRCKFWDRKYLPKETRKFSDKGGKIKGNIKIINTKTGKASVAQAKDIEPGDKIEKIVNACLEQLLSYFMCNIGHLNNYQTRIKTLEEKKKLKPGEKEELEKTRILDRISDYLSNDVFCFEFKDLLEIMLYYDTVLRKCEQYVWTSNSDDKISFQDILNEKESKSLDKLLLNEGSLFGDKIEISYFEQQKCIGRAMYKWIVSNIPNWKEDNISHPAGKFSYTMELDSGNYYKPISKKEERPETQQLNLF